MYFCKMFKFFTPFLFSSFVFFIANGQILINEYTGANYDTYTDGYGEYEDWVELYNPTATAIDISGWYLSDKVHNPTKWMIPSSFIIPSNGTAIVYCSGRDELVNYKGVKLELKYLVKIAEAEKNNIEYLKYKEAIDLYNNIINSDFSSPAIKERVKKIHEFFSYK